MLKSTDKILQKALSCHELDVSSLRKNQNLILQRTTRLRTNSPYTRAVQVLFCTLAAYTVLGATPIAILSPIQPVATLEGLTNVASLAGIGFAYLSLLCVALKIMHTESASEETPQP